MEKLIKKYVSIAGYYDEGDCDFHINIDDIKYPRIYDRLKDLCEDYPSYVIECLSMPA